MVWFLVLACLLPTNVPLFRTSEPVPFPHIAFRVAHQNGVCSFVLSPNRKILATGGFESTIKLWDAQHGELLHSLSIPGETAYSLAFSPDSATLASGSDNHVANDGRVTSSHAILWDTATGKQRTLLGGENGKGYKDRYVDEVAFSPDGTQIAVSTDKRDDLHSGVDLWDAHTGALLRRTSDRPGYFLGLAFSPDGSAFAIGFADSDAKAVEAKAGIYVWDTGSGVLTRTLSGHGTSMLSPRFSPDGSLLASDCTDVTGAGSILIWDARTGVEKRKLVRENTSVYGLVFSPDGRTLASGHMEIYPYQPDFSFSARYEPRASHTETIIWDLASGKPLHVLPSEGWISPLAYSSDGSQLVTRNSVEEAKTGEAKTGEAKGKKGDQARHIVLSLWDTKTGALLHSTSMGEFHTVHIVYTPDGNTLLMGGTSDGSVRWLDSHTLKIRAIAYGRRDHSTPVAFAPDGNSLAWGGHSSASVLFWNTQTGRLEQRLSRLSSDRGWVTALSFSANGKRLATVNQPTYASNLPSELRLWDMETGQCQYSLKKTQHQVFTRYIRDPKSSEKNPDWKPVTKIIDVPAFWNTVALSPDGMTLVSGGTDTKEREKAWPELGNDSITWWNAQSGALRFSTSENCGVMFASAFSPNGRLLAACGRYEMMLWNADSGALIRQTHTHYRGGAPSKYLEEAASRALAFSPDAETLASGDTNMVRLWKVADGSEIVEMEGHTGPIHALAFSPTGALLASASQDGTVRLWNMNTHKPGLVLAHDVPVTSVAFAPNGRFLASGSADGRVRFWDPTTGALLLTVEVFDSRTRGASLTWIAYTPEGYYEGSSNINEVLRWRVGEDFFPAARFARQYHRPDRIQAALQTK